jgi:hypothetical protein
MADGKVGRPKGLPKFGGRAKGTPNKVTRDLKEMIMAALDEAGGKDYLLARANDPVTMNSFLTLVGKCLPKEVTGANGGPIEVAARLVITDSSRTVV